MKCWPRGPFGADVIYEWSLSKQHFPSKRSLWDGHLSAGLPVLLQINYILDDTEASIDKGLHLTIVEFQFTSIAAPFRGFWTILIVYWRKNEGITFRSTIKTTKGGSVGPQFGRVKAPFASTYEGPMVFKH